MGLIEGATTLPITPEGVSGSQVGPGTHDRERPFYNPAMQVNRDLSVLLVEAFAHQKGREIDVADVLAGAGARSLRLANEVDAKIIVHANDGDPNGIAAIRRGQTRLGIPPERLHAGRDNAHSFLSKRRFDVVDIDPFGSPMPLIDSAVRSLRHDGLLCITATDTAALSGTYPRVCRRRYGAWHGLHKAPWRAEVGLRILAGAAVQAAGRFDRAATPVLSVSQGHWMRVVMRLTDGKQNADKAGRTLSAVAMDKARMAHWVPDARDLVSNEDYASPLWPGRLHDGDLIRDMAARAEHHALHDRTRQLLRLLVDEADGPAFWAAIPDVRRAAKRDLPRRRDVIAALRDAGHVATLTHMDPEGIRTNASFEQLMAVIPSTKHL